MSIIFFVASFGLSGLVIAIRSSVRYSGKSNRPISKKKFLIFTIQRSFKYFFISSSTVVLSESAFKGSPKPLDAFPGRFYTIFS